MPAGRGCAPTSREALAATLDPARRSWVASANTPGTDFPIQNLPLGAYHPTDGNVPRLGVAIGDLILDLKRARDAANVGRSQACRNGRIIMLKRSIRLFDWHGADLCTQFQGDFWNGGDAVK